MDQPEHLPQGGYQLPYQGLFVIMPSQQSDVSTGHVPQWIATPAYLPHQLETGFRVMRNGISNVCLSESETASDASISLSKQESLTPSNSYIKQEHSGHVEVESCCRQDNVLFDENSEETNGAGSTETGTEDLVDRKINEKLASFIQFLMTNRQHDDWFKTLYNGTHRPANVGALDELKLNSGVKTNVSDFEDKLAYTQNCMLKGVTKTAYVMDTLFKHVEKLPKELQPKQLMSDLNAAMTFLGVANLEFYETRKALPKQQFKCNMAYEIPLMRQNAFAQIKDTSAANISTKLDIHTRRGIDRRTALRYQPYGIQKKTAHRR